jgi:hypothetical protein
VTTHFEVSKGEFLIRYYHWSLTQWERELESGFPLLNAFDGLSTAALSILEVMTSLSSDDRRRLAGALVRRVHKEARLLLQLETDPGDEALIQDWRVAFQRTHAMAEISNVTTGVDRTTLRRLLKAELHPMLGEITDTDRDHIRFQRVSEHWSIQTHFDLGGRGRQLTYRHAVLLFEHVIIPNTSPLAWLGITATGFDRIGKGEEPAAVRCVATLVGYFVEAVPVLCPTIAAEGSNAV